MNEYLMDPSQIPHMYHDLSGLVRNTAFLFMLPILIISLAGEGMDHMQDKGQYQRLIIKVLISFGLFLVYDWLFENILRVVSLVENIIMPEADYKAVIAVIFSQIKNKVDFGHLGFLKAGIVSLVTTATYIITHTFYLLLFFLRFVLLSVIYVVGPIPIVLGILKSSYAALNTWMRAFLQISAWTIILSILLRIIEMTNLTHVYRAQEANSLYIIAVNLLFCIIFVMTPVLTSIFTMGSDIERMVVAVNNLMSISPRTMIKSGGILSNK